MNAKIGQRVATEKNGQWKISTVLKVDCNIVKLHFTDDDTCEWLYRGSKRLGPISQMLQTTERNSNSGIQKKNDPFIEYVGTVDDEDVPRRNIAKKSTSRRPVKEKESEKEADKDVKPDPKELAAHASLTILNDNTIYLDDAEQIGQVISDS